MKRMSYSRLQKRENDLYTKVENLRYELYLHHHSPLFQLYKMHVEALDDLRSLFIKKKQKYNSVQRLTKQLVLLTALSHSPYMTFIRALRMAKWSLTGWWYRLKQAHGTTLSPKKGEIVFFIFGATPYTEIHSRGMQIALRLSEKYQVVYFEPEFRTGYKPGFAEFPLNPRMNIIQLKQVKKVVAQSVSIVMKKYTNNTVKHIVFSPNWIDLLTRLKLHLLVDVAHELITLPKTKNMELFAPHKKLAKRVVENGVDMELFKDASKTIETCDVGLCWIKRPVIGYIGALDERIDEVLIGKIAAAFPHATVVLVGNTNYRPVIAVSEKHVNIFPVGQQPSRKLSLYLQSFDILILPTRSSLKYSLTHESLPIYLASGKPVVAMATAQGAKGWHTLLYRAKNSVDFIFQVEKALKESKKSSKRKLRIQTAEIMKWNLNALLKL